MDGGDLVKQITLIEWFRKFERNGENMIRDLIATLVYMIHNLHEVGIEHGDLAFENFLVTLSGKLMFTDFGSALTRKDAIFGRGLRDLEIPCYNALGIIFKVL